MYTPDDILKDKTYSQDLQQKFIIEISDIMIIVLNKMSFPDQKLLSNILSKTPKDKKVIIIHNFSNLNTIEAVKHYINVDVERGADNFDKKVISEVNISIYLSFKY